MCAATVVFIVVFLFCFVSAGYAPPRLVPQLGWRHRRSSPATLYLKGTLTNQRQEYIRTTREKVSRLCKKTFRTRKISLGGGLFRFMSSCGKSVLSGSENLYSECCHFLRKNFTFFQRPLLVSGITKDIYFGGHTFFRSPYNYLIRKNERNGRILYE